MEQKIRKKSRKQLISRYLIIGVLICFWVVWTVKSIPWGKALININPADHFMAAYVWVGFVKFLFYFVHILINFLIFLVISMHLRQSFIMLAATILILLIKVIPLLLSSGTVNMPMQLPLYVDVVLIFSIAGHLISKSINT